MGWATSDFLFDRMILTIPFPLLSYLLEFSIYTEKNETNVTMLDLET